MTCTIKANNADKIFSTLGQQRYHPSKKYTLIHKEEPTKSVLVRMMVCVSNPKRHGCCGKEAGKEGCIETWSCCKQTLDNEGCQWRYKCCQMDVGKLIKI